MEGEADGTSREPRSKNKLEGETTAGSGDMDGGCSLRYQSRGGVYTAKFSRDGY